MLYRIDGEGKLDKLRWWEIDEGAHSQTIMDGRSGEILYEGSWGRSGKEDFEDEKDYEDIFWSGLADEAELRIWWECKAGGGQVILQDLIPDQSLKLVFCKDGREKIVRIFRKRRDISCSVAFLLFSSVLLPAASFRTFVQSLSNRCNASFPDGEPATT